VRDTVNGVLLIVSDKRREVVRLSRDDVALGLMAASVALQAYTIWRDRRKGRHRRE
jgi:hypothetical protein